MKHRHFWGALLFWTLLLLAVGGQAIIHSRGRDSIAPVGRLEAEVNGGVVEARIWRSMGGPLPLREMREEWLREGWTLSSEGLDLAAVLLGIPQDESLLTSMLAVEVFTLQGRHRTLAILDRDGDSFALTAETGLEIPKIATSSMNGTWIGVPSHAEGFATYRSGSWQGSQWTEPLGEETPMQRARNRGFSVQPAPGRSGAFHLTKGRQQGLLQVETSPRKRQVSLTQFENKEMER